MATSSEPPVPQRVEAQIDDNDWDEQTREAYRTLYAAMPGDMVLWADRSQPMEVDSVYQRDDETRVMLVEKPRADGTYEVRESWDDGTLRITSPIGRATNLHFVERGRGARKLTDAEVSRLVDRLAENAVDSFMRQDYEDWSGAVADVVEDWSERVSLRSWQGYKHHPNWEDGDPEAIFESVIERLSSSVDRETADDLSVRERAEAVLVDAVVAEGLQQAEASLVNSKQDYRQLVQRLAHHTVDRIERKSYADAHVATRDTVSNWIDERETVVHQAIIEHTTGVPFEDDDDIYEGYDTEEELARERAFDILQASVWEEVQGLQRSRNAHDPTLRGMTFQTYDETVDYLAGETLRRWGNDGFLRTTARDVVSDWADSVEAEEWDGHRYDVWAAGDVEDIFTSAAIHSTSDPKVLNPFSEDQERRMAEQAILPDVVSLAEDIYDEDQPESDPVPVDQYLDGVLGTDTSYGELKAAQPQEIEEVTQRISEAATGDEVGWTFVDEIIEAGGAVPEVTNNWVLIDYGVLREGDELRKLAWFDRSTGDVLALSGMATAPPRELADVEEPFLTFHVTHHKHTAREPEYVCEDVTLEEGLECVYEFVDATKADIRIIETRDQDFVQEQITHEDINAGGVIDSLVPNLPFGKGDLLTAAAERTRGAARFTIHDWAPEMAKMASYTAIAVAPRWLGDRLDGIQVEAQADAEEGLGTNVSKEFGKDKDSPGVGGQAEMDLYVRPKTFTSLHQRYTPEKLSSTIGKVLDSGDLGKGVTRSVGETLEPGGPIRASNEAQAKKQVYREVRAGDINTDVGEPITDTMLKYLTPEQKEEVLNREQKKIEVRHLQALALNADGYNIKSEIVEGEYHKRPDADEEKWEKLQNTLHGRAHHLDDDEKERVEVPGYGTLLADEFLGSVDSVFAVLRKGYSRETDEEFSWDEFEKRDIPISGMLMRGLDAETLVAGAEFFDLGNRGENGDLKLDEFTFTGGDYEVTAGDPPSFEEWKRERYGPGKPPGPEREARLWAQYHQEVNQPREDVDPYETLGIDEERVGDGDYDMGEFDSDDGFGNDFDDVAERVAEERGGRESEEFERSVDAVGEGQTTGQ